MTNLIADISILRSASEVFHFTTDPENTPKWIDFIEAESASEWPAKVGTIYTNRRTDGSEKSFRVIAWDPCKSFQLEALDGSFVVEYDFESIDEDSCRLRISLNIESDGSDDADMQSDVEKLKVVMESRRSKGEDH